MPTNNTPTKIQAHLSCPTPKDAPSAGRVHFSNNSRNVTNAVLNEDVAKNVNQYFDTFPSCRDGAEEPEEKVIKRWHKARRACFPMGFRKEFKHLVRLAIPIAVTSMFTFTYGPVSIAFCGHLGQSELASIGLATSIYNMAGMYVVTGLLTASDTIFAQIYGSQNLEKMSSQLKKTMAIVTIGCIPCCSIYIVSEPLLLLMGQNPQIAKTTADFLLRLIPTLLLASWGQVLTRYAQNQNHVYTPLLFVVLTNGVNALLHYIFLFTLNLGINGSAYAQSAAFLFQDICFLLFIRFSKSLIKIDMDCSVEYLRDWGSWLRLAIPGLIMVCLEGVLFELGGFVAGSIGELELAVQTVLISLDTISYTLLPHGFGTAAGIRVGQYLGGQQPLGPRSTLSVGLVVLWAFAPVYFSITASLRNYIPQIFSNDPDVIHMAANLIPLTAVFQILDGANGLCSGVLRGSGLQHIGAIINFVSLYMIGAPISACLVFLAGMSIKGIWIGLIVGTSVQIVSLLVVCFRMNWDKQVEHAMKRVNVDDLCVDEKDEQDDPMLPNDHENNHSIIKVVQVDTDDIQTEEIDVEIEEPAESLTRLLIMRLGTVLLILTLLAVSICCRSLLNLSNYFGPFCIFHNGTFVKPGDVQLPENCTLFFS